MTPSDIFKQLDDIMSGRAKLDEKKLISMMGSMFQGADLSIAGLQAAHSDLCSQLAKFDLFSALRQIGGLETIPELQKNGVRIGVLLHLAHICCRGDRKANSSDISSWLESIDQSPTKSQEDPPEDVFVGYICSPKGGFRVFSGIISHADFILERLLRFIIEKLSFSTFGETTDSLIELLKLSEAVADQLDLPRYLSVNTNSERRLALPHKRDAEIHAEAITFSPSRLSELQIDFKKLTPFIINDKARKKLLAQDLYSSSLTRFPIIEKNGSLVIFSPALICLSGIKFVLEATSHIGAWADAFFEKESAAYFINEVISPLGIKPIEGIDFQPPPLSLPPLYPFAGQFDYGMPVLALTYSSSLSNGLSIDEFEKFDDDQTLEFTSYISACCDTLEQRKGFKGGMVLIALSGVGRAIGLTLHDQPQSWSLFLAPLADWQTLAQLTEFNARRLWYLSIQERMAKKYGVKVMNISGLINLYGFWKKQNFVLIPASMDLKESDKMLTIDGSFSNIVNTHSKNVTDRHCCWHPIESQIFDLQRDGEGLNPDIHRNLKYVEYTSASNGVIRGCISLGKNAWWIETANTPTSRKKSDLKYKLWECVMSWCERLMLHIANKHLAWIPQLLVLQLNLEGSDTWDLNKIPERTPTDDALKCKQHETTELINITIKESFLSNFFQSKNIAERMILTSLVDAFFLETTIEERKHIVLEVMQNEDARFFHVLHAESLESVLSTGRAEPLLVPEEELGRANIGLAFMAKPSPPERIQDSKQAIKFLGSVVAKLQQNISSELKKFAITHIAANAFTQLDQLSLDSSRWRFSIRSLLALENNATWILDHLLMTTSESTKAEISNRILIETACYSCNPKEVTKASVTEILTLLAKISVMIQLAEYREAVTNGLVDVNITISPNGRIDYSDSFRNEVMQPYLTSRLNDDIRHHVDAYDNNFNIPNLDEHTSDEHTVTLDNFHSVFLSEYGFSVDSLNKVIKVFSDYAIKTGRSGGLIEEQQLKNFIKLGAGLTSKQTERFLEEFVLPIRASWNKDLPNDLIPNDVLPWRFFRGLSVLIRPFVEVSKSPRTFAVSPTHLQRWGAYLIRSIYNGELPSHIFKSDKIKKYLGSVAKKEGFDFEQAVAAKFIELNLKSRQGVKMRELGKSDADNNNDIDVIAWDQNSKSVFLIECKNLKRALSVAQAIQQLENFQGDPNNSQDYLTKHLNRVTWILENPEKLSKITGIPSSDTCYYSLLITSGRVPMSYSKLNNFSKDQVWPFTEIKEKLTALQ